MKPNHRRKKFLIFFTVPAAMLLLFYTAQRFWAHRTGYFVPDYPRIALTEETDYETIFLQTGLGSSAVDKLIAADNFSVILAAQDSFFIQTRLNAPHFLGGLPGKIAFLKTQASL